MRTRLKWMLVVGSVLLGETLSVEGVWATDPVGFTPKTLADGTFEEFSVRTQYPLPGFGGADTDLWFSLQKTKGLSHLFVQSNEWQTGGTTGWHSHPGHSLIIVTAGTLVAYEVEDDSSCTRHEYTVGGGTADGSPGSLIDANHVHMLRNEGSLVARTVAVQLVPEVMKLQKRIDQPTPDGPGCPGE